MSDPARSSRARPATGTDRPATAARRHAMSTSTTSSTRGQAPSSARSPRRGVPRRRADRAGRLTWRAPTRRRSRRSSTSSAGCPGIGPKSAQRIAFHLLKIPADDVARLAARDHRRQGQGPLLRPLLQRHRRRAVLVLHRRPARRTHRVRRRGVPRHRRRRAHRRVPRPLPRAARRDEPARGHRSRAAEDPRAARPHRARGRRGGHPVHQPEHRGRGHGDVPRPPAAPPRPAGHPSGQRPPRRRRPRIRRRADPRPCPRRPTRGRVCEWPRAAATASSRGPRTHEWPAAEDGRRCEDRPTCSADRSCEEVGGGRGEGPPSPSKPPEKCLGHHLPSR